MLSLFPPPLLVGFPERYQIFYAPHPIRYASRHSWGRAQGTMNLDEVVDEIVQRNGSGGIRSARTEVDFERRGRLSPYLQLSRGSAVQLSRYPYLDQCRELQSQRSGGDACPRREI
jgi:hypothetical protein